MAGNYDRTYPVGIFSLNQYITYKLMFNFLKQEIMKKLLLLAPIAVLALASCSNDEQIAQSPALNAQELSFRPVVNGTTRTLINDANFAGFNVIAKITNEPIGDYAFWKSNSGTPTSAPTGTGDVLTSLTLGVTKDLTSGKWELLGGEKWFWSSKNAQASFTGYNASGTTIAIPQNIADITSPQTPGQKDVLVAYNEGVTSSFDNGVPLLFRHVLSQIVIKADNKDADIRQIKVAGVRIHNIGVTNNLTLPTYPTTADKFKWYSAEAGADNTNAYKPWASEPSSKTSKFVYYKGEAPSGTAVYNSTTVTLNASAQDITFDGPVLMLPQTNAAADLTASNITGSYIEVLVQVQDLEELAKNTPDDNKAAIFPKINVATTANPTPNETIVDQKFAWVAVPVEIAWNPGYKYTYVLHFSENGIGKSSPDTEGGDPNPGTQPGEEIVDNPVPLYFTVTIDEWNDAAKIEKDL